MVDKPPFILIAKSFKYLVDTLHFDGEDFIFKAAEDALLIMVARLMISSAHSCTDALDRSFNMNHRRIRVSS